MFKLPVFVENFMDDFRKKKYQIYLVGGAVRDLVSFKKDIDWNFADFATDATPDEIQKLFPDSFYDNAFGTVGVKIKNADKEYVFEVTTFRKEGKYVDLRHPEKIEWAKTITEDLARRDFTINAMALRQAQGKHAGYELIDPYSGRGHLEKKLVVAVGDPDLRFSEDALRLIRAVRFAAELGFFLDEKTRESMRKNAHLITKIAWERIRDEFLKILASDHPSEGVLFLRSTGILEQILPEIDLCFEIPQKSPKRHHIYDVGTHLVMSLKHCPSKDPITRFATLLHDIGKAKTFKKDPETGLITFYNHEVVGAKLASKIADRFRLSKKERHKLITLVRQHQFTVAEMQTDKAIRRFIRNVGKEYLGDILDLRTGDRVGSGATRTSWRLELFKKRLQEVQKEPLKVTDLKISGNDVMRELNLKPGPKVGEILNKLFEEVVEGKLKNEKEVLLSKLKDSQ
ncbi:CCA tRNA nucleotidyltransferase [Candidatus Roizmanbacteria bacterium]|nr:CCA tRNA nucleotidyltransferase [Candidatus Roizmanbacteria bacterium]